MTNLFKDVSPGENPPEKINTVVDIPSGGSNKIEYNHHGGYFELDRSLYSAVYYPFEYGFLPQSIAGDGDPLDIVLLTTHPTFSGCVVASRPIGILSMKDEAGIDDKIICVPMESVDPRYKSVKTLEDLQDHLKKEIRQFMEDYKKLEAKGEVEVHGWHGKQKAEQKITQSLKEYKEGKNV